MVSTFSYASVFLLLLNLMACRSTDATPLRSTAANGNLAAPDITIAASRTTCSSGSCCFWRGTIGSAQSAGYVSRTNQPVQRN